MKFLVLLLVVGTTIPSLTSAMPQELPPSARESVVKESVKKQITNKLCTGSPSTRSQCITEVEECMDFLQIDPTAEEMPEPDMEKICNGSAKLSDCIDKATKCTELLAKEPSDEPQSLTSLDTLPTKENLETICAFMETENCTKAFEKCFELIGPKANITGFPTREMFECSKLFDTYIEVTKNISGGLSGTTEGSVDTTEEGSAPTKEMMEARCKTLDVPNCVQRVEQCLELVGTDSSTTTSTSTTTRTPTKEMIECSSFLSQFADTTEGTDDAAGTSEEPDTTTTKAPAITREQMETMCRSSEERNCVDRFQECLVMVGPGANVPRQLSREMTECTKFLDSFSEAMKNITGVTDTTTTTSTAVTGITHSTTTVRSTTDGSRVAGHTTDSPTRTNVTTTTTTTTTTTLRPGQNATERDSSSAPTKENIESVCDFLEIPNCAHRVEECFRMRENKTANKTEAEKCAQVVKSYEDINRNLTERIKADRQVCETENCKRCETLIRPTRTFTSSQEECNTNTEQTLKECMKPVMERHLNQVGRPDIRQHIIGFFNTCYPKSSFGGISPCIIARCAEII